MGWTVEKEEDLTVHWLQQRQPWSIPYSDAFECAGHHTPHNLATHAVLHAMKSLGKIATVFESIDHRGGAISDDERRVVQEMAADLFTVALRIANLFSFSLVNTLRRPVWDKNKVDVLTAPVRVSERADITR